MESNLSQLSSLSDDGNQLYIQPHYKETYRLAIYALLCGGREAYEEFLRAEQISNFLSEQEIHFIQENAELPAEEDECEAKRPREAANPSTYFPLESDDEVPDLELGWPEVSPDAADTSISLLFNPPRVDTPTIKEVIRKQIQEARQMIAISMDVFTDVDIFKEVITTTLRGVAVYILLDESHFDSFLSMTHRAGVNIHDLKNMRVRTVQGQQYRCQSGVKFRGDLEQKFLLVDCQTVVYGAYSYTWSFEKINLSMVLVITGQLTSSFDEEFRRLFARSTVPIVQPTGAVLYHKEPMSLSSSHLSLHQRHMRSRVLSGMRAAQDERYNSATNLLTRGLSVQERLHQTHSSDLGNLVRGYSYGGELQKLNSLSRFRMGTKGLGASTDSLASNSRGIGDLLLPNRLSQQQLRHQNLYGADQNLIPFSSESSLHRWKMDTYLKDNDMDGSCDLLSPMMSPHSSYTGINDFQSQLIQNRSRDITARMEEMRQRRLSLHDYGNVRQSQEIHRPPNDRSAFTSLRGLDMRELEPYSPTNSHGDPANYRSSEVNRDRVLTDGQRSTSYYDVKNVSDRKPMQYGWNEPLSRTTSTGDLDLRLKDSSQKPSNLPSSGVGSQLSWAIKSLTEIPEEKEGSNTRVNSSEFPSSQENLAAEHQRQDQAGRGFDSTGKAAKDLGLAAPNERKFASGLVQNTPAGSQTSLEVAKGQTQDEEQNFQRKNSIKMKVYSLLSSDEKKPSKKDDKSLQRKESLMSSTTEHAAKKGPDGPAEKEKQKTPFSRLSLSRSSKRKTNLSSEQERGSGSTLEEESVPVYPRQRVYSRFEYLLTTETASKDASASAGRQESSYSGYQPPSGSDKKLGRFMQRVGNLIGMNK